MAIKEILTDEQGSPSAARTFLLGSLLFTGALIVLDSTIWDVPEVAYTIKGYRYPPLHSGCSATRTD
jgi:hypothetical protein